MSNVTIPDNRSTAFRETRQSLAALALRLAGATYPEVAEALGLDSATAARTHVESALANSAIDHEGREHLRAEEAARLDRLQRSIWNKATDPEHPDQFAAINAVIKLSESRRKLLGLDAPTEVTVYTPTQDEIERWVADISHQQVREYAELEASVIDVTVEEVIAG